MGSRLKTHAYDIELFGRGSLKSRALLVTVLIILGTIYAFTSDYNLATGSGNLSMVLFLAANVYFPAKRIRLKYSIKNVQSQFNSLLVWHIWLNTFAFLAACIHCYVSLWSNNWLIAALFMMGWLTFGGFLMWFKFQPGKVKKGIYLLHTQQTIFFIMIFAMLKGTMFFKNSIIFESGYPEDKRIGRITHPEHPCIMNILIQTTIIWVVGI